MNCGFSNLITLKQNLLAPALVASTDFDARIATIGLGVAASFENFCGRAFGRVQNTTDIFSADRCQFLLSRFPIESVSLIEMKQSEADGWQQLDSAPWSKVQTFDLKSGIVFFPKDSDLGEYFMQVRITYTGGFSWEQLEPGDVGYPTAQPVGSFALPADLFEAWLLQCKRIWESIDKIGDKISEVGPTEKEGRFDMGVGGLAMAPAVKQMLQQFVRYNLV